MKHIKNSYPVEGHKGDLSIAATRAVMCLTGVAVICLLPLTFWWIVAWMLAIAGCAGGSAAALRGWMMARANYIRSLGGKVQ